MNEIVHVYYFFIEYYKITNTSQNVTFNYYSGVSLSAGVFLNVSLIAYTCELLCRQYQMVHAGVRDRAEGLYGAPHVAAIHTSRAKIGVGVFNA